MQLNITINISKKHFLVLTGLLLALIISAISFSVSALTQTQVIKQSPAYHLLKDIYTVINGEYVQLNTSSGKINSSLMEITGNIDMNGYNIENVGNVHASGSIETSGSVKANQICINGVCKSDWEEVGGTAGAAIIADLFGYVLPSDPVDGANLTEFYANTTLGDIWCEQKWGDGWHWCSIDEWKVRDHPAPRYDKIYALKGVLYCYEDSEPARGYLGFAAGSLVDGSYTYQYYYDSPYCILKGPTIAFIKAVVGDSYSGQIYTISNLVEVCKLNCCYRTDEDYCTCPSEVCPKILNNCGDRYPSNELAWPRQLADGRHVVGYQEHRGGAECSDSSGWDFVNHYYQISGTFKLACCK